MPTDKVSPSGLIPITDSKTGKLDPLRSTVASAIASGVYLGLAGGFAGGVDAAIYAAWKASSALCVPTAAFAMRHGALAFGKVFAAGGAVIEPFSNLARSLDLPDVYVPISFTVVLLYAYYRMIVVPKVPTFGVPLGLIGYAANRFVTPAFVRFCHGDPR
ncbi:hypothetical protein C8R43DRAFT_994437 [Mycena crocata]|nr:hypothetical protein C8R43DRAFT_994437 [Mycena crocata]